MNEAESRAMVALDQSFAGSSDSLNEARVLVATALEQLGVDLDTIERARLIVSELTTNAVEASPGQPFHVRALVEPRAIALTVRNHASEDALPPRDEWGPDDVLAARGRGLAIVKALADEVELVEDETGWLEVTARLDHGGGLA